MQRTQYQPDAKVAISVDLIAQVKDAVHVSDHTREALPQAEPLGVRVAVAADTVCLIEPWSGRPGAVRVVCASKPGRSRSKRGRGKWGRGGWERIETWRESQLKRKRERERARELAIHTAVNTNTRDWPR